MTKYTQVFSIYVIFKMIISIVLGICFITFFKYVLFRRNYSKVIPSRCQRLVDFLGDCHSFSRKESSNSRFPLNHYLLKFVTSFSVLFKKEDLFCFWLSYYPTIFINSPKAVEEVLRNKEASEKTWVYEWAQSLLGKGLITIDEKAAKYHRKLLQPAFHVDNLKEFQVMFNKYSIALVESMRKEIDKDFTDISVPLSRCCLDMSCEAIFGCTMLSDERTRWLKTQESALEESMKRIINPCKWFDVIFFYLTSSGRKVKKDLDFLRSITISKMLERRKTLSETFEVHSIHRCLLDLLMFHHLINKNLSWEEVIDELNTFLVAAYDTTLTALVWTLYHIGLNQHVLDKIHEELDDIFGSDAERYVTVEDLSKLKYLECVIKESLRLCPPAPFIGRQTTKETYLCGYPIPKRTILVITLYALHRNEEQFPNPEVFDPLRFTPENVRKRHPYAFIPFFVGMRNCIGQKFAMIEMKTVLAHVLRNLTLESLDSQSELVHCMDIALRPSGPVRIRIRPRGKENISKSSH